MIFKQDYLLNLFIFEVFKILSEKKYGDTGLVSEKTEDLFAELN